MTIPARRNASETPRDRLAYWREYNSRPEVKAAKLRSQRARNEAIRILQSRHDEEYRTLYLRELRRQELAEAGHTVSGGET